MSCRARNSIDAGIFLNRLYPASVVLAVLLTFLACDKGGSGSPPPDVLLPIDSPVATTALSPTDDAEPSGTPIPTDPIRAAVAEMSVDQKVGQMLMLGFSGTIVDSTVESQIRDWRIGGLVFLGSNAQGAREIAEFTHQAQEIAMESTGYGLLLSIDQEGGEVLRLNPPFTEFPAAADIGVAGDSVLARDIGNAIGEEMGSVGLNMDLAPVLDVGQSSPAIGTRSFAEDEVTVSKMGAAFIAGLSSAGIVSTAKHFPGHGSVAVDSHVALPVDYRESDVISAVDLEPFRAAITAGVDVVMTAHVSYPGLDPGPSRPATVSPPIVTDLLRGQLGYEGVIITDNIMMGGITDVYSPGRGAVEAIKAGADIVLASASFADQAAIRQTILEAVASGEIAPERLDESVERILRLKQRYSVGAPFDYNPDLIGSPEHQALVDEVDAH